VASHQAEERAIAFVDAAGGSLSALAAAVATSLGVPAVAATSGAIGGLPAEIATVLEEVGMRLASAEVAPLKSLEQGARGRVVFLGADPPPELSGAPRWEVSLFAGEGELERLATARIARDRIERAIERLRSEKA
jgi:hypothetical protein